jgi:hypothetical protein
VLQNVMLYSLSLPTPEKIILAVDTEIMDHPFLPSFTAHLEGCETD